jgi:hypothetical protein
MDLQSKFNKGVDGVESFLLLPVQYMLLLKSQCIPLNVLAVTQPVALPDVFKGVQLVVSETQVIHSEVD